MSSEHERGAGAAIPSFVVDGFAKFDDGNLNDMSGYGLTLVTYSKRLFGFVGFRVHHDHGGLLQLTAWLLSAF